MELVARLGELAGMLRFLIDNDIDVLAGHAGVFFDMAGHAAATKFHDESRGVFVLGDLLRGGHRGIGKIFAGGGDHSNGASTRHAAGENEGIKVMAGVSRWGDGL